jgi:hypothetical protein
MIAIALLMATTASAPDAALVEYARLAPGRYTTAAQAARDPRYDVVEAEVVRIWPERSDGIWIYQEQAIINREGMTAAQAKAQPYFQRVGHVHRAADGRLRRDNYVLKAPKAFIGRGTALTPADLGPAGCHNILERVAEAFWTARTEQCANGYKGATEMRSISVQTADTYANWDRGFAGDGRQVWGPADGGYIFVKMPR